MSFKYEIGDEFRVRSGEPMTVVGRHSNPEDKWYWVADRYNELSTWGESSLDGWFKVEPFFEVGDRFTSIYNSDVTMTITHLDEELKSAWATGTFEGDEHPHKETVSITTWRQVKDEVLRNRKG